MADPRESFCTLEDSSGIGTPLDKSSEGYAAAGKIGSTTFSFKDSSGNLVLPQLDVNGKILVTSEGVTECVSGNGEVADGSASLTTIATATLTASKTYSDLEFIVSCFRDSLFQIILNDNGTPTVLAEVLTGSGQYTVSARLDCRQFTSGATGTQQLLVKAKNMNALSSLRATVAAHRIG